MHEPARFVSPSHVCLGAASPHFTVYRACCILCVVQELINKIDKDGSGEIEYEEFKTLLS